MECKNCNTILITAYNYCSKCGARVIHNRLTLSNLWGEFTEVFFNYDNLLIITFRHLFTHPENVINGFINGVRKRYFNPISYYALSLSIAGLVFFLVGNFFQEQFDLTAWYGEDMLKSSTITDPNSVLEYQTLIAFLAVPIVAVVSKIVFKKNKQYNFTEHLIIYLYTIPQTSILNFLVLMTGLIIGINIIVLSSISIFLQLGYNAYVLKRVFDLSLAGIIVKTLLFLGVLVGILFVITILKWLATILFPNLVIITP